MHKKSAVVWATTLQTAATCQPWGILALAKEVAVEVCDATNDVVSDETIHCGAAKYDV